MKKRLSLIQVIIFAVSMSMLIIPAMIHAQSEGPPPIGQQLVREGTFAVRLEFTLGVGTSRR